MNKQNIQYGIDFLEERGIINKGIRDEIWSPVTGNRYTFFNEDTKETMILNERELEIIGKVDEFWRGK